MDVVTAIEVIELDVVDSTQDEVQQVLDRTAHGVLVAVTARSQRAGRGRAGRTWVDAPGRTLALSAGIDGVDAAVLEDLPRRIARALLASLDSPHVAWKSPNDLVDARTGAKVAGILIDARTTGPHARVVVGIGINVTGPAFEVDGRAATTLEALGVHLGAHDLQVLVVDAVAASLRCA